MGKRLPGAISRWPLSSASVAAGQRRLHARKRELMNVRKPADYSAIYRELTEILARNLPQMDEIYAIGKAVSHRPEKGAAVAAAEFLQTNLPDRTGFSPRNVRRMRDFYKVYENGELLLRLAMKIGWTLNVVIMEAELTVETRKWHLKQAKIRNWTKSELQLAIIAEEYKAAFAEATAAIASNQTHRKKRIVQLGCNKEIEKILLCILPATKKQAFCDTPMFPKRCR